MNNRLITITESRSCPYEFARHLGNAGLLSLSMFFAITAQAAPTPEFIALQACLKPHPDGVELERYGEPDGSGNWGIGCVGTFASKVWTALYPYRVSQEQKRQSDNSLTSSFHIGRQSYCMKVITNADGRPGDHVECTLFLDLDDKALKSARFD